MMTKYNPVDVVYVVGRGSKWDDNELRYSLRSLAKHVTGIRDVWIVGHRPAWCTAKHIPMTDPFANDKEANIIRKVLRVCGIGSFSPTILLHSDDHFWLGDMDARTVPLWHKFDPEEPKNKLYRIRIANTERLLRERGATAWRFDCHAPMPIDRDHFVRVFNTVNWHGAAKISMKIVYGNLSAKYFGMVPIADYKASPELDTLEEIALHLAEPLVFSTGSVVAPAMKAWLAWRFPDPSPWEQMSHVSMVPSVGGRAARRSAATRGVITAANDAFMPCATALVRSVVDQGYSITVFDHGLSDDNVLLLREAGADMHYQDGPRPLDALCDEIRARHAGRTSAPVEAWWKPFVCEDSPYEHTIWIDADAISLQGLDSMFEAVATSPWLTRDWWIPPERVERLYGPLVRVLFPEWVLDGWVERAWINTGVIGFARGDALIEQWARFCSAIMQDPDLLALCKCRDQSGMAAVMASHAAPVAIAENWRWNYPAHGLMARDAARRPKCPAGEDLLAWARREHPNALVVHWLGKHKAWGAPA